ncbi:DEAD/DEAH box helicase [Alkalihalophilus pseudofirmus]|uniref:DEAD/DEAH box helicase n=1 Tax=Alkalihalophilus pseudofirmus TaxID=79885 RepID=UPI00259B8A8C|nr:DEAD/DEAH box helicase [Alkalihalophilus pseudofirmus]WEG16003.1 DEAD/DEAH box helicase [Alkalihalophilus pseudofirmus]
MNKQIMVHCGWLEGNFFLWAEKLNRSKFDQIVSFQYPFLVPAFELKLALYRHDQNSFYGTFVETEKAVIDVPLKNREFVSPAGQMTIYQAQEQMKSYSFPIEGIRLSINELLDQSELIDHWDEQEDLVLSPDLKYWMSLFSEVKSLIARGDIEPKASGEWNLSSFRWNEWSEALPKVSFSLRPTTAYIQSKSTQTTLLEDFKDVLGRFADSAIRSLLNDPNCQAAYKEWIHAADEELKPSLEALATSNQVHIHLSEQAFGERLGTVKVEPFKTALALVEPNDQDDDWSISLCVIDREYPSQVIEMSELERGEHPWRSNPISQLKKDVSELQSKIPILDSLSVSAPTLKLSADQAYELFTIHHSLLKSMGIHLIVPKWLKERKKVKVELTVEGIHQPATSEPLLDWQSLASFTYQIAIGDSTLTAEQFDQFVKGSKPFIYANGEWISWDPKLAAKLQSYLNSTLNETTYFEALKKDQDAEEWIDELDVEWDFNWGETLEKSLELLYKQAPPLIELPESLHGELRPYQHQGVSWIAQLRHTGFGGCLADDMGLGKSIQTIAYILFTLENQTKEQRKPFLLICPTSLIYNWLKECEKFAPSARIFIHHGQSRLTEQEVDSMEEWDIILTSYQLAVRDTELLKNVTWNGLILDEAQHIKNVDTKQRRAIKQIKAAHRLALTGTPIENRLKELWSLIDVINPSFLGSFKSFQDSFIKPIEKDQNQDKLKTLQQLIYPFILRRKKSDELLHLGLPEKLEQVHKVTLSVEQAALYQAVVDDILSRLNQVSQLERRALILKSLTKLKQICNHPAQFLKTDEVSRHDSRKWDELFALIEDIHNRNEKVLIFSQFKEMGRLIAEELERRYQKDVPFLHGSLTRPKRQEAIERFQEDPEVTAFVLSLKAGGVGLNLTAANHVIHYDRWWNPAVENQATDRAFRIGQTKDVTVHKLMTSGTLEERIDKMLTQKQSLADQVLQAGEQQVTELSNEEIHHLIRLTTSSERSL